MVPNTRPAASRSALMAWSTPGYCTLTATARSSRVMARCTWPMEAEAMGTGSHSRNTRSGGAPSSRSTTPAASWADIGGTSCWRPARASRTWGGRPVSRYDAIWPNFMKAPFMLPSTSATCSAVRSSNRRSSSAWRSAPAKTRRARCRAKSAPARPPIRASWARRWPRLRAEIGWPAGSLGRSPAGWLPTPELRPLRRRRAAIAAAAVATARQPARTTRRARDRWAATGGQPNGRGGAGGQAGGPLGRQLLELVRRDDPIDQADAFGLGGRHLVAEEHQLLGPLHAHEAGEEPGAAAVGHQAPPHEHLDEPGAVGGQHEIAGQGQVRPDARGRAVDGADHRLLAVEHGADQPLRAAADRARHVADEALGPALGPGRTGARHPQIGPGTEVLAGAGDDHHPHLGARAGVGEQFDHAVALVGGDRVAGFGPVEDQPQHALVVTREQLLFQRALLRHGATIASLTGRQVAPPLV